MKEVNTEYIHVLPNGDVYIKIYRDGILCEEVFVGRLSMYRKRPCIFETEHEQYILEGDMDNIVAALESLCISYLELPW